MLQNLDKVNWVELGAPQMPNILQKIQSDHIAIDLDKQRKDAWDELQELLYPQGIADHWDWGGPRRMMQNDLPQQVTPFLIEILGETKSLVKMRDILGLLGDLCKYEFYHEWLGSEGQAEYIEWSRRLRDKVRLGLPLYQQYLTSSDEYLKGRTQELMKWLDYK